MALNTLKDIRVLPMKKHQIKQQGFRDIDERTLVEAKLYCLNFTTKKDKKLRDKQRKLTFYNLVQ